MEVTLIVVTLLSIALAIAMGILTWRLLQEERLRSDARVAALEQGLAETLQDAYVTQAAASSAARPPRAAARSPRAASGAIVASPSASRHRLPCHRWTRRTISSRATTPTGSRTSPPPR